jgi:hypothetical protein
MISRKHIKSNLKPINILLADDDDDRLFLKNGAKYFIRKPSKYLQFKKNNSTNIYTYISGKQEEPKQ